MTLLSCLVLVNNLHFKRFLTCDVLFLISAVYSWGPEKHRVPRSWVGVWFIDQDDHQPI